MMMLPFTETNEIRGLVEELDAWKHLLDIRVLPVPGRGGFAATSRQRPWPRQVWMAVEEAAEDVGMDRRLANALWDAFFGREVTAGYYRSLTDVSPATATKDLTTAVAARLLASEGERRGRRDFAGERLYGAVAIPDSGSAHACLKLTSSSSWMSRPA